MIALLLYRLYHTAIIASLIWFLSYNLTFNIESNKPAPAILSKSSRVELDLTANNLFKF